MLLWVSAYGVFMHLWFPLHRGICFVWSVSMGVPGSRWVCLCVSPGLWRRSAFLPRRLGAYQCISASQELSTMCFCPQWNHPVPMFNFSGISFLNSCLTLMEISLQNNILQVLLSNVFSNLEHVSIL